MRFSSVKIDMRNVNATGNYFALPSQSVVFLNGCQ